MRVTEADIKATDIVDRHDEDKDEAWNKVRGVKCVYFCNTLHLGNLVKMLKGLDVLYVIREIRVRVMCVYICVHKKAR